MNGSVDELYEQYLQDRHSVDPAWWDFFADYVPSDPAQRRGAEDQDRSGEGRPDPAKAAPESRPAAPQVTSEEATVLRGPAARVVTNMEASLGGRPGDQRARGAGETADRQPSGDQQPPRTQTAGEDQLHPPDRLRDGPGHEGDPQHERLYAEIDGKPAVVQHESVGLGIAIDMSKPDGTRQLLVPSIKKRRTWTSAAFRHAYEDLIHRARNNKLGSMISPGRLPA